MESANYLEQIWVALILISCASSWTAQEILFRQIKKNHYEKWVEIGEPGFKTAFSLDPSKFQKFRLTVRYLFRGDAELDADVDIKRLKTITKSIYLLILLAVIAFFIVAFKVESTL